MAAGQELAEDGAHFGPPLTVPPVAVTSHCGTLHSFTCGTIGFSPFQLVLKQVLLKHLKNLSLIRIFYPYFLLCADLYTEFVEITIDGNSTSERASKRERE